MKSAADLKILVLENEPMIAMLLEDMLGDMGFSNVVLTEKVEEARQAIAATEPDFAFLDFNLYGETSCEIAALLKQREVPFVFLSGSASSHIEAGFAGVKTLQKPFQPGSLKMALQAALPHALPL